jgi:hypothetical protein
MLAAPVMRAATLLAIAITIAGCGSASSRIAVDAAPIVDRLMESPSPQRWNFTYESDSASPYVDCLNGLDSVSGAIDVDIGVLRLTPERAAPALIVTRTSLLVGETNPRHEWREVALDASIDEQRLVGMFGEVLARYIITGIDAPDLRTTVLAAVEIASTVETTPAPAGLAGDAVEITLDPDLYLDELTAAGITVTDEDLNRIPTITAVVDPQGRVTGLLVDPSVASGNATDLEHRDRYVISATYDDLETLSVPSAANRSIVDIDDVDYSDADESCAFGS